MKSIYTFLILFFLLSANSLTAQYTAGNLVVLTGGNGSTDYSGGVAAPIQLRELKIDGTYTGVNTVTFPSTGSSTKLVQSGSASSEGDISISSNGKYICVAGYNALASSSDVKSSTSSGVIGRVNANASADLSTVFARTSGSNIPYYNDNFRSVCSNDGTQFWGAGNGSAAGNTGIFYFSSLGATSGTQINNSNTRSINVFSGQLYVSGSSSLNKFGSSLPTSSSSLSSLLGSLSDAYSFIFFDRDPTVTGNDLVYIVNQNGATGSSYGVLKYSYNGSSWTSRGYVGNYNPTGTTNDLYARNITGRVNCSGGIDLYIVTTNTGTGKGNKVLSFTDAAAYNSNITSNGGDLSVATTILSAPPSGTSYFGGICFTPTLGDISYSSGNNNLVAGQYRNITITGGATTLTGNVNFSDTFYVASNATLICNGYSISGNRFILASGATLKMGSADGITSTTGKGNLQLRLNPCGIISTGGNFEYTSSTGAKTGNLLPTTVNNLTLANNRGDTATNAILVNGILTVSSITDTLDMGTNILTLGSSATVTGSGIIRTQSTATTPIPSGKTWNTRVEYNGGTQNIVQGTYSTLIASGSGTTTKTLTVGNSSVSDSFQLKTNTTFALGNFYFTIKSTPTKTARVAAIETNAAVTYGTGRFVIERYFDKRRSWRLITAPITVDGTKTIYNSWQTSGATVSGNGIFVTGPSAPANGLDVNSQNTSSLKTFNTTTQALVSVSNPQSQLISGTTGITGTPDNIGFFNFVRGDRTNSSYLTVYDSSTTTIRDTGKIQINTQTFTASSTGNYKTLIGNPYASPVDFNLVTLQNVHKYFYAWDPKLNDVGGYVLVDDDDNGNGVGNGTFTITPSSPGGQNKHIQSTQSVFVKTLAAGGTAKVIFNESNKSNSNNLGMFRPAEIKSTLRVNLFISNVDSNILADGNLMKFDNSFNDAADDVDVEKAGNSSEMISWVRDGKNLVLERRKPLRINDTLFLKISKTTQRKYKLQVIPSAIAYTGLEGILVDKYTNEYHPINLAGITEIDFYITGDVLSQATDRFYIIFNAPAAPLPVTFVTVKAHSSGKFNVIDWSIENEIITKNYTIEFSNDGIEFNELIKIEAGSNNYSAIDSLTNYSTTFYRIKATNKDGSVEYSKVVKIVTTEVNSMFSIYPNPVIGKEINLYVTKNGSPSNEISINLFTVAGQKILSKNYHTDNNAVMQKIKLPAHFKAGIYQINITNHLTKQTYTESIIIK